MFTSNFEYSKRISQQQSQLLSNSEKNSQVKSLQKGPFKFQKIQALAHMPQYQRAGSEWSDQQIIKFAIFIVIYSSHLESIIKQKGEKWHVFKKMSAFIKKRNPNQCRSYFLKIIKKFDTLKKAIQFYQLNIKDLSYKIQRSRFQLRKIQEQQQIFRGCSPINKALIKRQSIKSQNIILSEPKNLQKFQKQQLVPTAASYYEQEISYQQKPVNNYKNQNSFTYSNRFSFSKNFGQKQKHSIPSFQSIQGEDQFENNNQNNSTQKFVKIQQKNENSLNQSNLFFEKEFIKPSMNVQSFLSSLQKRVLGPYQRQNLQNKDESNLTASQIELRDKRRQAFQECHKYFTLWMGKLWKIMQQYPKQQIKQQKQST